MQEKVGLLDIRRNTNSELDFVAASLLNHKIAQNCITKLKDANNTAVVSNAAKRHISKTEYL
jgi:hypothetical protein